MFTVTDIEKIVQSQQFREDYGWVARALATVRLSKAEPPTKEARQRLLRFIQSVLCCCTTEAASERLLAFYRYAAECSEILALIEIAAPRKNILLFRAVVLNELAGLPAISSALAQLLVIGGAGPEFLRKQGHFLALEAGPELPRIVEPNPPQERSPLWEQIMSADAMHLLGFEQGLGGMPSSLASESLLILARDFDLGLTMTDVSAFGIMVRHRAMSSTRSQVNAELFALLKRIRGPSELLEAQSQALREGILNTDYDSWAMAAPTGSGKSFLARILILDLLRAKPDARTLYLVPSRALVSEVSSALGTALELVDLNVLALSAQLVDLDNDEKNALENAHVVVLTPEKADLLIRINVAFMQSVKLVVIDEAHHIESGTRGILLELYLWRIKLILPKARFVLLSAVAPNIHEISDWVGQNSKSFLFDKRATRMRAGVYKIRTRKNGSSFGVLELADGNSIELVDNAKGSTSEIQLCQLCAKLLKLGPVLVVAKSKKESEKLSQLMQEFLRSTETLKLLTEKEISSDLFRRLDSRLEREMYSDVPMRELVRTRIAYHHAGLPPRVRQAVEGCIRNRMVDFVFATTTLAEGVNFPFSSVIVQSLALKAFPEKGRPLRYHPITPRVFWNIAGRAGRPGIDREGLAVLFEPSLGAEKVGAVMEHYLNPDIKGIAPVRSALADGLEKILEGIDEEMFERSDLNEIRLGSAIPKSAKGAINLIRVGIIHAKAARLSTEEIVDSSFAARFLNPLHFAEIRALVKDQEQLILNYFSSEGAPSLDLVASLGISMETVLDLHEYVLSLQDWQIRNFSTLMYGGCLNFTQAKYVVGPVAKRMAELEGEKLGAIYSDIILQWLSGVPFSSVERKRLESIEDLISIIYSRVQYLLPWGLYALDALVEAEAKRRILTYRNEIRGLAYLADAGVPSFDALRLTRGGIERVDATRIAAEYQRLRSPRSKDIVTWIRARSSTELLAMVSGSDNRRTDHDFDEWLRNLKRITAS